jgi:hypothetical protein
MPRIVRGGLIQARVTHEGELAGIMADDAQVAGYRVTRA